MVINCYFSTKREWILSSESFRLKNVWQVFAYLWKVEDLELGFSSRFSKTWVIINNYIYIDNINITTLLYKCDDVD
jgi:hypothetical protein